MLLNENFAKLPGNYLFSTVAKKRGEYAAAHPEAEIISLGIGDVTMGLPPAVIAALHEAVEEQAQPATFQGYGPDGGYEFLRQTIAAGDFASRGLDISAEEIYVSDGAKQDSGNIQELFAPGAKIALTDPVYPVYVDSNVMAGRAGEYSEATGTWSNLTYLPTNAENGFVPELPADDVDVVYLCLPNNPTGTVLTKDQLQVWVDWANRTGAVILFDAAYEAFITEEGVPHSIYECEGARTCAIEIRSFSKTAGFTGLRLSYTVIPRDLERDGQSLLALWNRRQGTKFNQAPYIVQKAGLALYSEAGKAEARERIDYYLKNAGTIKAALEAQGFACFGGVNSPYVWLRTGGLSSWEFFDQLLEQCQIVGTPGSGFGPAGEGYFRLTGFGSADNTAEACARLAQLKL